MRRLHFGPAEITGGCESEQHHCDQQGLLAAARARSLLVAIERSEAGRFGGH
jgi:hypothetical protein